MILLLFPDWCQIYSSIFSLSQYGYRYRVTLCIGQLHPITVYGTVFWMSVFLVLSVIMCSFYYFRHRILIHHEFHHELWITLRFLWPFFTFWTTLIGLLLLSSTCSAYAQLSGCFTPGNSANIGLDMLPPDDFMSCLYSTEEFQALQRIVLVAFGAMD